MKRLILTIAVLVFFPGCSLPDFKSDAPPVTYWRLDSRPPVTEGSPLPVNLVLLPVETAPGLDGDFIMLLDPPSRYDHYANAAWPDDLPRYLGRQLLLDLTASGRFAGVHRHARSGLDNWRLEIRVTDFQVERRPGGDSVHLRLHASLVQASSRRTHSRWHEYRIPIEAHRMRPILRAFSRGWNAFLQDLVEQLETAIGTHGVSAKNGQDTLANSS